MTSLQAAIGAVNDLADAPLDAVKPRKPIPSGLVRRVAAAVAIVAVVVGSGCPSRGVGDGGYRRARASVRLAYDLWLKGTAWSWLPFALGIPLLPVYAWLGATGSLPRVAILVPVAVAAGAGLAIGNGLADAERDAASRASSRSRRRSARGWAWTAQVVILGAVGGRRPGASARFRGGCRPDRRGRPRARAGGCLRDRAGRRPGAWERGVGGRGRSGSRRSASSGCGLQWHNNSPAARPDRPTRSRRP